MKNQFPRFCFVLFLCVFFPALCFAQFAQRSSISGYVMDSSGAVVVNATVTLEDLGRNQSVTARTDESGHYEFAQLNTGRYRVSAEYQAFKKTVSAAVDLQAQNPARIDLQLVPGVVSETIEVKGGQPLIETEQAAVQENIESTQIQALPINGRNFTSLAVLTPGVSTTPRPNVQPGGTYDVGASFSAGGTQYYAGGVVEGSRDNGFYLNGVNINENYQGSISYAPSPDALGEVRIAVTDFSAANGHDITTFNAYTKAGTNTFHGSAYDYLENDALNAQNPFDKMSSFLAGATPVKPALRRNQYGGNLGGPVYIPKILNRKNRAFFFVNYERYSESGGGANLFDFVPSDAERAGDFSGICQSGFTAGICNDRGPNGEILGQLYNPYTTVYASDGTFTRQLIPGNRIDQATKPDGSPLIDPNSAALLDLWPHANNTPTPQAPGNYRYSTKNGQSSYHFDSRFDLRISDKNNLFVSFSKYSGQTNNSGGVFPQLVGNLQDQSYIVTVNDAHSFSSTLTNEFIFAIGDGALITQTPSTLAFLNSDKNPFNSIFQNTGSGLTHGVLAVYVSNYASPGFGEVFRAEDKTLQFSDNLNWIRGRHSFTFGMNYFRKGEFDWDFVRYASFGGAPTFFSNSGSSAAGGDAMADLVMGLPLGLQQRYNFGGGKDALAPELDVVFPYWGFYANDKIKLSPNITLTLGLRYDLNIPLYANNNLCCAVYRPDANGGTLALPGIAPGLSQHYLSAQKTNFAPRIGLAYQLDKKTVVRVGYGLYYDSGASQISGALGNALNGTPGYFTGFQQNNVSLGVPVGTPALHISDVFPPEPLLAVGEYPVSTGPGQGYFGDGFFQNIYYYDQKTVSTPYYQRFLLDVQREITPTTVISASYVGALGANSPYYKDTNVPAYQTGWASLDAFNAARPNNLGRFGETYVQRPGLSSSYNAAILRLDQRLYHGLTLEAHYTYSKTISDRGFTGQGTVNGYNYPQSIIPNRGEASLSHPHRFLISLVYAPVYGQSLPYLAKLAVADWSISTIANFESGDALTTFNQLTTANDFAGADSLNLVGNPNSGPKTFAQWFNTAAFQAPPLNVRGKAGPGIVRGPGQHNVDISLSKTLGFTEHFKGQLRADFYNAFNHTQWNSVNTTYNPADTGAVPFGQITGGREGRIIQIGFKLFF